MKKCFVITFASIALFCQAIIATPIRHTISLPSGAMTYSGVPISVQRTEIRDSAGILIRYIIPEVTLIQDSTLTGKWWCGINEFGQTSEPRTASRPYRMDKIRLPYNCDSATITVTGENYVLKGFHLTPSRRTFIGENDGCESIDSITSCHFSSENDVGRLLGFETYRNQLFAKVGIYPVQYDSDSGSIKIFHDFTIRLAFVEGKQNHQRKSVTYGTFTDTVPTIKSVVLIDKDTQNRLTESTSSAKVAPETFMIVTTPKYTGELEAFTRWKRQQGYNVILRAEYDWTVDGVKSVIKGYYDSDTTLTNVLIVGGINDVPAKITKEIGKEGNQSKIYTIASDFRYSCLDDDNDDMPDIAIARIPVDTAADAVTVLNKFINYEKNPPSDESYYKHGINAGVFQVSNTDIYSESGRFIQTCEEIKDYLEERGKEVTRVYNRDENAVPINWGNKMFGKGGFLPEELQYPTYRWDGDAADIVNAINRKAFYVLYRGHGDTLELKNPNFSVNSFPELNNKENLPIVFSLTCLTGSFHIDCFASQMLRKKDGGCVGIFAGSSRMPAQGQNDAFAHAIFTSLWPDPGIYETIVNGMSHVPLNKQNKPNHIIGSFIYTGISRIDETYESGNGFENVNRMFKERIHLFGDPSMLIFTDLPEEYTENEVSIATSYIKSASGQYTPVINLNVCLTDEEAFIGIYDAKNNKVSRYHSASLSETFVDNSNVKICVYGPNRIPKIYPEETPQPDPPIEEYGVKIVPNPASSTAVISFWCPEGEQMDYISIYTLGGRLVRQLGIEHPLKTVYADVSSLANGQYIVCIVKDGVKKASANMLVSH